MTTGTDILDAKVSIPSELRSAQWSALPVWLRERAFFMASVNRAEVLDANRSVVEKYTRGEIGRAEARTLMTGHLDRLNYQPLPGQQGTIKDLRSEERQNVVLDTNLLQVNGFARWARQQGALEDFPAQRLVRFRNSKKKRNWIARWTEALSRCGVSDGATDARFMTALVNHPIWIALSHFGTPYPPFDFNSGMGLTPVGRSQADELDILPTRDSSPEHQQMMQPQDRSLNETLAATPAIRSQIIRSALAEQMRGMAKWGKNEQGESQLNFTDPNGTQAHTAEELAEIWKQGMPDGLPLLQRAALIEWLSEHKAFEKKNDRDKWQDIQRLHKRLVNGEMPSVLYRGLAMSVQELADFMQAIRNGYAVRKQYPGESFTSSLATAQNYARSGGSGWSVLLGVPAPDTDAFKDMSPLVRSVSGQISKQANPPVTTEAEWLLRPEVKFGVKSVRKDDATRTVKITLYPLEASR